MANSPDSDPPTLESLARRYLDLWRSDAAGAPKLAERIVVCDSSRIDTLLALPL